MPKGKKKSPRTDFKKLEGSYIIPVMGPTGSGKSTFINELFGTDVTKVGYSLDSCTSALQPFEVPANVLQEKQLKFWDPTKKVVIVDTPGFDDTCMDDSEILKLIADWLANSYGAGAKLSGIIYLHDISAQRITGTTKKNFDVFEKLCGAGGCRSVVLGTTKWRRISGNPEEYKKTEACEKQLHEKFWKEMINRGSKAERVDELESPWNLVDTVLNRYVSSDILQIQNEMVRLQKTLPQTEAAAVLRQRIEEQIKSLKQAGATKDEVRAFVNEVEALKERSVFGRFWARFKLFG